MAGINQHYIPQMLLRAFGKSGRGKAIQVTVYSRDRGVFTTATDGAATERHFYSERPLDTRAETLDDRITAFEARLATILAGFRATLAGGSVDATEAAEAVTHLCVRQAHLRASFASAAAALIEGTGNFFRNKEWLHRAMGLHDSEPNEIMQDTLNKIYQENELYLKTLGFTKESFERFSFDMLKDGFDTIFPQQSFFLSNIFQHLRTRANTIARDGHVNALAKSLAPEPRIEVLNQFTWRIEARLGEGLILPDCVAMSWSAGAAYSPLVYGGKDIDVVFMPLAHDRLLVGERDQGLGGTPCLTNEVSATCSWDYFIGPERAPEFEQLIPRVGERSRQLLDEAVHGALDKVGQNMSRS